jgi:Predicted transcriptional regulators
MFFQRLKDLREDKDLLQGDIAEILMINRSVYSRYERGFQTIPIIHLLKLADFYKTSTDYILGRTDIIKPYDNCLLHLS